MFGSYIGTNEQFIRRLVIDELHQLLLSQDYRPNLRNISVLWEIPIQKILLTATLPPALQEQTFDSLGIAEYMDDIKVIRDRTDRPDLSYNNFLLPRGCDMVSTGAEFVRRIHAKYFDSESRGMIFCRTVKQAEEIGRILKCRVCTSRQDNRDVELNGWREGKSVGDQWIACTTCLTHGLNQINVRWIIWLGSAHDLPTMIQGGSRGCRNGGICYVLVIHSGNLLAINGPDHGMVEELNLWLLGNHNCRRTLLSEVMDGVVGGVTCATLPGAQRCDLCDPDSDHVVFLWRIFDYAPSNLTLHQYLLEVGSIRKPLPLPESHRKPSRSVRGTEPRRSLRVMPSSSSELFEGGIADSALAAMDLDSVDTHAPQDRQSKFSIDEECVHD